MATTLNIKADVARLSGALSELQRKQLPYATALALTGAAKAAQADVTARLPSIFDRPTPFTMRAIGTTPARKNDLTATVFVKDKQAQYLQLEVTGGTRTPAKRALVLPVDIRLNAYGNMTRQALQLAKAKPSVFVGTIRGVGGFWQRKRGDRLVLLAAFKRSATYKPRFDFAGLARAAAVRALPTLLADALARALATARP